MNNTENSLSKYASLSQSLISFMEHSQHYWFMKDKESRYIHMNDSALNYMHCQKGYDVAGKKKSFFPAVKNIGLILSLLTKNNRRKQNSH